MMLISSKFSILLPLAVFLASSSCTTTKPAFPKKYVQRKAPKSPTPKNTSIQKQGQKGTISQESSEYLPPLLLSFLKEDYVIQDADISVISTISIPPQEGSLEEAVLTLGNLKFIQRQLTSTELPQENEAPTPPPTIESQFQSTKFDLVDVLLENPFLQSVAAFKVATATLSQTVDSLEYRDQIKNILIQKSVAWKEFADEFNESAIPTSKGNGNLTSSISKVDPSQYRAADLLIGDTILLQAQKLAEKGRFKSAIGRAKKVGGNDPFFPAAQEKIKYFSNLAVQELRQKAAQAFQSSLPVVDIKTKAAYLVEAKKYLEEALNEFPAADHLTTVQENLAVITKDLESIDQDTSQR